MREVYIQEKFFSKNVDKTGIYSITCKVNNKVYIGYANHFNKRWDSHKKKLRYGYHRNPHLQSAWDLYGEQMFKFERIELCSKSELKARENYWCKLLNTHNNKIGYNLRGTGEYGVSEHSKESKEKIRAARKLQVITQEHKDRISQGLKGYKRTKEEYQKSYRTKQERGLIRPVIQMTIGGIKIKEWESAAIACSELKLHRSGVSNACKGKIKSTGGYTWKYKPTISKN